MKATRTPFLGALILLTALLLIWGCAEMKGEKYTNQAPTVNFVNTPKDAHPDSFTTSWVNNMPFTLFSSNPNLYQTPHQLVQFPEVVINGDTLKTTLVSDTAIYIKGYVEGDTVVYEADRDYTILDSSTLVIQVIEPSPGNNARMEATTVSGDTIQYFANFKLQTPSYYVFSYAPTVHWFGSDPDGFVEYYSYADIKYAEIEAQLGPGANPSDYKSYLTSEDWIDTYNTSATVYLLSETGDTTEHVLYLKCFDNDDASSPIVYRTFFRSNQPPNVPEVKWDAHPDDAYDTLVDIRFDSDTSNNLQNYDNTLFCLENITPIWSGIILRWRGDDPDDKELYTIPLTYQYYLMTVDDNDNPVDTLWEWSTYNDTTGELYFTEDQSLTMVDLESGEYMFSVWSFDDGFEPSPYAAALFFKCVKPLSEEDKNTLILYDETMNGTSIWELIPNSLPIDTFYVEMMAKMADEFDGTSKDFDVDMNTIWDDQSGDADVTYWDNSGTLLADIIPPDILAKYKLVIWYSDDYKHNKPSIQYMILRDLYFQRYLEAGGRIWLIGRGLFGGSFGEYAGQQYTDNTLLNMMQVQEIFVYRFGTSPPPPLEFVGAFNAISYLDTLALDQEKANSLSAVPPDTGLAVVDWMGRDEDATTLYYYNSITGGQSEVEVDSGVGYVMDNTDSPPYSMPSGNECWITVDNDNLISVTSVINLDKLAYGNGIGEVKVVTSSDEIQVNYALIDTTYDEYAQVCEVPEPTPTACCIETDHYDQDFTSGTIYNENRDSYGTVDNIDVFEVQVSYPTDTVTCNDPDAYILDAVAGYFDPNPDSCAVQLSKNFVIGVNSVTNNTQGQTGTIIRRITNVVIVGTNGTTWSLTDDIDANYDYLEYWEPGDAVHVVYESSLYWEKGDNVVVDYSFNPTSNAHLKPCAIRYEYYEIYNFTIPVLFYRSAVFSLPLYFVKNYNSLEEEQSGEPGRVDKVFYEMLDWFLDPGVHLNE